MRRLLCFLLLAATSFGQSDLTKQHIFEIRNASHIYDFTLIVRLQEDAEQSPSGQDALQGRGTLIVRRKQQADELQRIELEDVFVALSTDRKTPLVNTAPLYDYQGALQTDDFNFDGKEDFAIQTGNKGPYGQPSYDVFLFQTNRNRFRHNDALTNLVHEESLGFFQVDTKEKRLIAFTKSGCCYHAKTEYAVIHDAPVPVRRSYEDCARDRRFCYEAHQRMVRGRWVGSEIRKKRPKQPKD